MSFCSGTVRFELTTFFRSARFQDECHKPDSTKYPLLISHSLEFNKTIVKKNE